LSEVDYLKVIKFGEDSSLKLSSNYNINESY